jgi:ubiquinone/menaquinone biosynthesis C-methylase UbiE
MATPSNYVLGQSDQEYQRLMLQARLLRPWTEKFFRSAGIVPGMSVLDIGSGIGDVALLAGDIVGPGGRVLGLDRDAAALQSAAARTIEQGCSGWVRFQTTNLEEFETADRFDALVGRYILLYQPDAAQTVRQMARFLRPGGIIVFHELDFTDPQSSFPRCPLWDQCYALLSEAFRRAGAPPDFGRRLARALLDAGLPWPTIQAESVAGGGRGSYLYTWISSTLRSVAPRLEQLGLAPPEGVTLDESLTAQLEEAAVAAGCQIVGPMQVGAWTRKPLG